MDRLIDQIAALFHDVNGSWVSEVMSQIARGEVRVPRLPPDEFLTVDPYDSLSATEKIAYREHARRVVRMVADFLVQQAAESGESDALYQCDEKLKKEPSITLH